MDDHPASLDKAVPYVYPDGRLDAADVGRQIAWYKAQNLLKGDVKADDLIDGRYAMMVSPGR